MLESITGLEEQEVLTSDPGQDADVAAVVEALEISALVKSLHRRAVDLQKTISACTYDMQTMRQMLAVAEEAQSLKLGVGLRDNTKVCRAANARAGFWQAYQLGSQ